MHTTSSYRFSLSFPKCVALFASQEANELSFDLISLEVQVLCLVFKYQNLKMNLSIPTLTLRLVKLTLGELFCFNNIYTTDQSFSLLKK